MKTDRPNMSSGKTRAMRLKRPGESWLNYARPSKDSSNLDKAARELAIHAAEAVRVS